MGMTARMAQRRLTARMAWPVHDALGPFMARREERLKAG